MIFRLPDKRLSMKVSQDFLEKDFCWVDKI